LGTEYFTRVTNLAVPLITGQVINQTYTINTINQNGTAYVDNKEYNTLKGNPALTTLQRVYNAEGYTQNITATTPNYYYYRRDHLGNNREVWLANTKKTVQYTQYYPSGLPWASIASDSTSLQERKYNGKEFVEMHGYDTYDYGARGYYAAMVRFQSVDPLAELYYSVSPYAYCLGNPVNRTDPDGMSFLNSRDNNKDIRPYKTAIYKDNIFNLYNIDIQKTLEDPDSYFQNLKDKDNYSSEFSESRKGNKWIFGIISGKADKGGKGSDLGDMKKESTETSRIQIS
jgi:RHS repeat-associated protein